jgi:stage III sporulation protein SpoIIIAA
VETAAPRGQPGQFSLTDDLDLLLSVMPERVRRGIERDPERADLLEIVLDLGRPPEARYPGGGRDLGAEPVSREELDAVVERVGRFGADNRAGIERTLHRISALRNRDGAVVGLTCRVGRAVFGTVDILRDVIESGASILLLGRPGVGKTTLLREAARVLADELGQRVVVVDTSNEIAGDGDVPHPGIGRARRMQVPSVDVQDAVMIEAVENHMPEVIVIDEIGTRAEALAARTIAERGVQLIATAHGNTLDNLLQNPTLSDLVGGIQAVTLSDEEARRRRTQKTVLERKAPPTFDVLIEIQDKDSLAVHRDVAEVVDQLLRGEASAPEVRRRTAGGRVEIEPPAEEPAPAWPGAERRYAETAGPAPPRRGAGAPPPPARPSRILRVFPYAVARSRLEHSIDKLRVPVYVVDDPLDADVLLTTKAQERRRPRKLREAEVRGAPLHLLRSNTVPQMEKFLRAMFPEGGPARDREAAVAEAREAAVEVLHEGRPVELPPRGSHLRRLQHEVAAEHHLPSESRGVEPYRRVVIYPRGETGRRRGPIRGGGGA